MERQRNAQGRFMSAKELVSDNVNEWEPIMNLDTLKRIRQQVQDVFSTVIKDESNQELRAQAAVAWRLLGTHIYDVSVGVSKSEHPHQCWLNFNGTDGKSKVGIPFCVRLNDKHEVEPFMTGREYVGENHQAGWKELKGFAPQVLRELAVDYWTQIQDHSFLVNVQAILKSLKDFAGSKILGVHEGQIVARAGFQSWVYPTVVDMVPKDTYLVKQVRDANGYVVRDRKGRMVLETQETVAQFLGVELPKATETQEIQEHTTAQDWMAE